MPSFSDVVVPILGVLTAVVTFKAATRALRGLPRKNALGRTSGPSVCGNAEINGALLPVRITVKESALFVTTRWYSSINIGLSLNMKHLHLKSSKAFIGTQVLVTSTDPDMQNTFRGMVISNGMARRIDKISNGAFGYAQIG